ncbi:MAG: T9SS type A sorting domain-containing protein [Candidatus Celaenobacter antarcticus]|nr:T9SS type A sorting domain-containing protein [Candidatus Celaenobacter antarcticus]
MKKIILIAIFALCMNICLAQDITLNKIVEYPTSGFYLEKNNLHVHKNHFFAASSYGLEIYRVEEDEQAQLVSRLPLRDDARTVAIKNEYAYVQTISYFEDHTTLYKINISDVNNLSIIDSVYTEDEDGFGLVDIYNDFIIFKNYDTLSNNYYSIYRIPEFEFLQNYYCDNIFKQVNDSMALYRYDGNIFTLYDFSDLVNIVELGQVNLNDSGIYVSEIQSINDSILACIGQEGIAFWKYSINRNWEYISTIYSPSDEDWSDKLYVADDLVFISYVSIYPGMKSINISDVSNPYIIDSKTLQDYYYYLPGTQIVCVSNSVFLGTYQKIHQFVHNNGYFEEQYHIYNNDLQRGGVIYNDYLFVSYVNGLKIYDISSLTDIILINSIYNDIETSTLFLRENLLFFVDFTNYRIIVLDISTPETPIVRNEIPIPMSNGDLLMDEAYDESIYYKEHSPNKILLKYSIPEPNNYTVDFQYNLGCTGCGFIYNDYFYYLAGNNPDGPDLKIYGGLEENNPELFMTIEDFAKGYMDYPNSYIQNRDSLFYLGSWMDVRDSVRFYEIGEPTEINYRFTTQHRCDKSILIDGNYLFTSGRFSHIYAYDLSTAYGLVEPVIDYSDYGLSQYCLIHESNNHKYLYHFQSTAFSIYEIEGYSNDDEPEVSEQYFTSYPNPFSTSTTISLSLTTNLHEFSRIKIYNVKGQLVRELKINPDYNREKINEAVWDGRDDNGNEVGTGVYFYKLSNSDEHIGEVVKLR